MRRNRGTTIVNQDYLSEQAPVDPESVRPFPSSQIVYEIRWCKKPEVAPISACPCVRSTLSDIHSSEGIEHNLPISISDTSGPYTDPDVTIGARQGRPALRAQWIQERGDTDELPCLTSEYGRERLAGAALDPWRFTLIRNSPVPVGSVPIKRGVPERLGTGLTGERGHRATFATDPMPGGGHFSAPAWSVHGVPVGQILESVRRSAHRYPWLARNGSYVGEYPRPTR